jgi:cytochrome c-type biogenesis protein
MTSDISLLALATSFAAGTISFLSPCVLPLVPAYVSYVAGQSLLGDPSEIEARHRLSALGLSALFVLGFSTVFVALGASATALGRWLLFYRYEANLAAGSLVIVFGLVMIGFVRLSWFGRDLRFHPHLRRGRPVGAYVLGLAFAFGWTPCIGPVLGAILTASAVGATAQKGIALLAVYSLGLGLPFLMAALFTHALASRLKALGRIGRSLQAGAGVVMVGMGLAMVTGELTAFSYWLLETFPVFSRIG